MRRREHRKRTRREYEKLVKAQRLRGALTIKACRMVMVGGLTGYAASQATGLHESVISRALTRLERDLCPHCGQPMPQTRRGR